MNFHIKALLAEQFSSLYGLTEEALSERGVLRYAVTDHPGFPCRVSLLDAEVGETALLINFEHQPAATPYRSSHAIFVTEGAQTAHLEINEVPEQLRRRTLSLRAFDEQGMMRDADLVDGIHIETLIDRLFADAATTCIQVHNASRGCYAATIVRA